MSSTSSPSRPSRPRRSVLYVPGGNERAIAKARTLACDAVIFDLEDSVAPDAKVEARENLRKLLGEPLGGGRETIIRINALSTPWGAEDLRAAQDLAPDAILIPKVEDPEDIAQIDEALDQTDAPETLRLWAMIETPKGIMNAGQIARASRTPGGRLDCFVTGTNDIVKETGPLGLGPRDRVRGMASDARAVEAERVDLQRLEGPGRRVAPRHQGDQRRELGAEGEDTLVDHVCREARQGHDPGIGDAVNDGVRVRRRDQPVVALGRLGHGAHHPLDPQLARRRELVAEARGEFPASRGHRAGGALGLEIRFQFLVFGFESRSFFWGHSRFLL